MRLCRANAMELMEAWHFTRFTMPWAPVTAGLDDRIKAWRANGNRL
jgi:hypothetical protein